MISSLAVLYVIDLMYQKYNPTREYRDIFVEGSNISCNQSCFENDVIPACEVINEMIQIFNHKLISGILKKEEDTLR